MKKAEICDGKSVNGEKSRVSGRIERIKKHHQTAAGSVRQNPAAEEPADDEKQTPMHGHPVFKATHGCACCQRDNAQGHGREKRGKWR